MEGVTSTSTIALDLAPWELVFLEIVPRPELAEPVAMGARWNRDSNGSMKVSSEGSSSIRILAAARWRTSCDLETHGERRSCGVRFYHKG